MVGNGSNAMSENSGKVLVVDDDQVVRIAIFEVLNGLGYQVSVAENGEMALDMLQKNQPEMIFSDLKMPGLGGIELLRQVKISQPQTPVVIVTGFASVDSAVDAMKMGAFDYILKPCPPEVIKEVAVRAMAQSQLSERDPLKGRRSPRGAAAAKTNNVKEIIGCDPSWLKVVERAEAVASSKANVLVLGESGTGKEVMARYLHNHGERRNRSFVALNCAALPDGLLESELFGHEKGAFTGAVSLKKGKFELADGGTLLLDEIGEVPLHLQAKLLRVLQESEVDRLGGSEPVKFDVHVVATTNRNLSEAVEKKEFRQDLYYRLNVIPIRLPSLAKRGDDVFLLADFFIKKFSKLYGKAVKKISKAACDRLRSYQWPGNVRELENMIERAVLLGADAELEVWDIWDEERCAQPGESACSGDHSDDRLSMAGGSAPDAAAEDEVVPLRIMERQMIVHALQKTDNNRTHAAKILGISVRTLRNKLNEYRNKGYLG